MKKLTITVGADPCVRPVCRHVATSVDVYRATARVAPTVAVRKSET